MDKQVKDEFSSQPSKKLPKKNRLSRSKTPMMPISRGPTAEYDQDVDQVYGTVSAEVHSQSTPPILESKPKKTNRLSRSKGPRSSTPNMPLRMNATEVQINVLIIKVTTEF